MPSEKSRYLDRNREPQAPIEYLHLKEFLSCLESEILASLIWSRAVYDTILLKSAILAVGMNSHFCHLEKAKQIIDYALHFNQVVGYTEEGYGQILDTIRTSLESFVKVTNQVQLALKIANYAIERAEDATEYFEDDWDWSSSLEALKKWTDEIKITNPSISDSMSPL